jgi:hypothetical protein
MSDYFDAIHEEPRVPEPASGDVESAELTTTGDLRSEETVEGVPVLAEAHPVAMTHGPLPAVQAAAVAATGFVAGAAALALVRRHSARKVARRSVPRRAVDMLPIVGSRTFIVDVHLLAKPGE